MDHIPGMAFSVWSLNIARHKTTPELGILAFISIAGSLSHVAAKPTENLKF
jgi:hypothetical protein